MNVIIRLAAAGAASVFLALSMSGPAQAIDGQLAIDSITLEVGDEGSVLFQATDIPQPGVGAWNFRIAYDSTVITVTECVPSPDSFCDPAFEPNTMTVFGSSAAGRQPSFTIASFEVRCLAPGTTALTIDVRAWSEAGFELPPPNPELTHGSVTCRGPSPNDGRLAIDSIALEVGDQGSVLFAATDIEPPGVGAWTLDVVYDPSVVAVTECVPSPLGFCNPEFESNVIRVNGASASGVMPELMLAEITFRCLVIGVSPLTIDVNTWADSSIPERPPPDVELAHGSVNCLAPTAEATPAGQPTPTVVSTAAPVAGLPSTGTVGGESPTAWFAIAVVVLLAAMSLGASALWRRRPRS